MKATKKLMPYAIVSSLAVAAAVAPAAQHVDAATEASYAPGIYIIDKDGVKKYFTISEFTFDLSPSQKNEYVSLSNQFMIVDLFTGKGTTFNNLVTKGTMEDALTEIESGDIAPGDYFKLDGSLILVEDTQEPVELTVENVEAINATTILVKFAEMEPVEIKLDVALLHGQTEVAFTYKNVPYTYTLTEPWLDIVVLAEEAIAALPAVEDLTLEDTAAVEAARELVTEVVELGIAETEVSNLDVLEALEVQLEVLLAEKEAAEALAAAILAAEEAIAELPEVITLADQQDVEAARVLVLAVYELDLAAEVTGLDVLAAAEATIAQLLAEKEAAEALAAAILAAEEAIAALPAVEDLTLEDTTAVEAARELVNEVVELGGSEAEVSNLDVLVAAEDRINELNQAEVTITFTDAVQVGEKYYHAFLQADVAQFVVTGTIADEADRVEKLELIFGDPEIGIEILVNGNTFSFANIAPYGTTVTAVAYDINEEIIASETISIVEYGLSLNVIEAKKHEVIPGMLYALDFKVNLTGSQLSEVTKVTVGGRQLLTDGNGLYYSDPNHSFGGEETVTVRVYSGEILLKEMEVSVQ